MVGVNVRSALLAVAFASLAAAGLMTPTHAATEPGKSTTLVDLIRIDGTINPAVDDFISASIRRASADRASALVIELDTPGGMLSSTRHIVRNILGSPVPVIIYVTPSGASAASAGMFITLAAHVAAMAPGTTIGAAHPVELGGGSSEQSGPLQQKIENFTATFAQSIARQRGHDEKWVEEAVRHSATLGEREALTRHVIDIVAANLPELLQQASGREVTVGGEKKKLALDGATVRRIKMTLRQQVLDRIAEPNLVYLLLMAGVVGLYFEFAHPGVFLPGVAGAICLLLALASFEVLPINVAGLLLLALGISMLIAEAWVPSHGILGLGGVIAFVFGSLFLIDRGQSDLAVNRGMIAGAAVGFSAIILGLGTLVARDRRAPVRTGLEGLIGEVGEVTVSISPSSPGRVFVHGEIWRASSDDNLAAGMRAQVVAASGVELKVKQKSSL